MNLFINHLVDIGISDTRADDLAFAIDKLHLAICEMDQDNRAKFAYTYPEAVTMAEYYANIEELNADLWGAGSAWSAIRQAELGMESGNDPDGFLIVFEPDFEMEPEKPKHDNISKMEDYRNDK